MSRGLSKTLAVSLLTTPDHPLISDDKKMALYKNCLWSIYHKKIPGKRGRGCLLERTAVNQLAFKNYPNGTFLSLLIHDLLCAWKIYLPSPLVLNNWRTPYSLFTIHFHYSLLQWSFSWYTPTPLRVMFPLLFPKHHSCVPNVVQNTWLFLYLPPPSEWEVLEKGTMF